MNHDELVALEQSGKLLIGVDSVAARKFFTDSGADEIARVIGETIPLERSLVRAALYLGPVALLASAALSIWAFQWWSILIVPASIGLWLVLNGIASRTPLRLWPSLIFLVLAIAACFLRGAHLPFQVWLAVIAGSIFFSSLTYYLADYFLRLLVIRNELALEALEGHAVFVKEAP